MSSGGAIRSGRAFVELFTEDSAMMKGLVQAKRKFETWSLSIAKISAIAMAGAMTVGAPLIAATKSWANLASEMSDASIRTGTSIHALSELRYAVEQSGASFEDLEEAIKKANIVIAQAEAGSQPAIAALSALGLRAKDLASLSPDERLKMIADALAKIPDAGKKSSVALGIFGKAGSKLLPLLAAGSKGIAGLMAQARALGLSLSAEDAAAAAEFNNELDKLWAQVTRGKVIIGSALVPMMASFAVAANEAASVAATWMQEHKGLARIALLVAAGLAAVSLTAGPVAALFRTAAVGTGLLHAGLLQLGAIVSGSGAIIGSLGKALAAGSVVAMTTARSLWATSAALLGMQGAAGLVLKGVLGLHSLISLVANSIAGVFLPALAMTGRILNGGLSLGLVAVTKGVNLFFSAILGIPAALSATVRGALVAAATVKAVVLGIIPAVSAAAAAVRATLIASFVATKAAIIAVPAVVSSAMGATMASLMAARAVVGALQLSFVGLRIAAAAAFAVITKNPLRTLSAVGGSLMSTLAGIVPVIIAIGLKIALWGLVIYGIWAVAKSVFPAIVSLCGSMMKGVAGVAQGLMDSAVTAFNGFAGWAGRAFEATKGFAVAAAGDTAQAWTAIQDALVSGDWSRAGKIMMALIGLEWARGIDALMGSWQEAKAWILDIWDAIGDGITLAWNAIIHSVSTAWTSFVSGMLTQFAAAQHWIANKLVETGVFGGNVDEIQQTLKEDYERKLKSMAAGQQADQAATDSAYEQRQMDWSQMDQKRRAERQAQSSSAVSSAAEELRKAQAEFASVLGEAGTAKKDGEETGSAGAGLGALSAAQKSARPQLEGSTSNLVGRMFGGGDTMPKTLADLLAVQREAYKHIKALSSFRHPEDRSRIKLV